MPRGSMGGSRHGRTELGSVSRDGSAFSRTIRRRASGATPTRDTPKRGRRRSVTGCRFRPRSEPRATVERGSRLGTGEAARVKSDLLVLSAAQLITAPGGAAALLGPSLNRPLLIPDAAIAVVGETIAAIGPTRDVAARYPEREARSVLDAKGRLVAPGFVDAHTHLPFAGTREMEFEARAAGESYEASAARGGVIRACV